jgi:hypothetical protein
VAIRLQIALAIEAIQSQSTSQENYYRQLRLRDRIVNLLLMVTAVLTLLWRIGNSVKFDPRQKLSTLDGYLSPKKIADT